MEGDPRLYIGEQNSDCSSTALLRYESEKGLFFTFHHLSEGSPQQQKKLFGGRSLPNVFSHPPTPGFLGDLGERKVKFRSKNGDFQGDLGGF